MKKSLKQKLSLLLALALVFTMAFPTSLLASAEGEGDQVDPPPVVDEGEEDTTVAALEDDVTNLVDASTAQSTVAGFSGEGVDNLFVADFSTKFCGTFSPTPQAPLEFTWSMTEATAVQTIAITSASDSSRFSGRDPKSWILYGSEDGENWTQIDARENQGFATNAATKIYTFDNTTAYTSYKLSVTANNGTDIVQLSCIQLSTKKYDSDADTIAAAAAAAFDEKVRVLEGQSYSTEFKETVENLFAEYAAFDTTTKNKVTTLSILNAAQALITAEGAVDILNDLIAEINAEITAINEGGDADYHLNGKITHAYDLYNFLSEEKKDQIVGIESLETAREVMDMQFNDYFEITVNDWGSAGSATRTPWMIEVDGEAQADSQAAAADELKYQFVMQGYKLGNYEITGATLNLTASWGNIMLIQIDSQPNDNVGNPWSQAGRQWSTVSVPFVGTAFSLTGYLALNDNVAVLSNAFYYQGNVYQQYFDSYRYYEYKDIALISEENPAPTINNVTNFPGYSGAADITNNTFRYAAAKYNQAGKWNSVVLGIPAGNAVATDAVIYQAFEGPNGVAYIAASTDAIDGVTTSNLMDRDVAFVLTGGVLDAVIAEGEGDFAVGIEITGAPVDYDEETGIYQFANGVIEDGVYTEFGPENEYLKVISMINALTTTINEANCESVKTAAAEAKAAYDALTQNQNLVSNIDHLTAVETAITTFEADLAAANAVDALIDALGNDITLEDEADIVAARTAYDALNDNAKTLVKNLIELQWAENELQDLKDEAAILAVEDLIANLPADEHIDGENLTADTALVEAALAAFNALRVDLQNAVDGDLYDALIQKKDIVDAGGYEAWVKNNEILKGDLDGNKTINVSDVVALRQAIMNGPTDDQKIAGDMDGNGTLNVSDVVALRQLIMNSSR